MRRRTVVGIFVIAAVVAGSLSAFLVSQRHVRGLASRGDRVNILVLAADHAVDGEPCTLAAVVSLAPEVEAGVLLMPWDLRLRFPDGQLDALSLRLAADDAELIRSALADFLLVDIPFYVEVDYEALQRAVDTFGPLPVAVQEQVQCTDAVPVPPVTLEFPVSTFAMEGRQIVSYLRCTAQVSRYRALRAQQEILSAILSIEVGGDASGRAAARALHPLLRTNLSLIDLYDLTEMAAAIPAESVQFGILPASELLLDGAILVEPRIVETTRMVARLLRGEDFLAPADVRVAVFNGNGARDVAKHAGEFLRARSFAVVHEGNAESFDYEHTFIVHFGDADKARLVAAALPGAETILSADRFETHLAALRPHIPERTDALLVLGEGYEDNDG